MPVKPVRWRPISGALSAPIALLLLAVFSPAWFADAFLLVKSARSKAKLEKAKGGKAKRLRLRRKSEELILLVGIYTAPTQEAALRRKEVRDTYWKHRFLKPGGPVQAKFIVGHTKKRNRWSKALTDEIVDKPGDFVQLDVQESYHNLTQKTLQFLRWAAFNSTAKFVLKMDDDTFPHLKASVQYLRKETADYLHLGLMFPCAPVLKFTKWAENPAVWNHTYFPRYMQGSGYFLSAPLVKEIAVKNYEGSKARMLNNEDAAVGLWIELLRWQDPNIEIEQRAVPATLTGCHKDDLLSMNNQLGYMNCYWRNSMKSEEDVCCYGPLRNAHQSLLQVASAVDSEAGVEAKARARLLTRCYGN